MGITVEILHGGGCGKLMLIKYVEVLSWKVLNKCNIFLLHLHSKPYFFSAHVYVSVQEYKLVTLKLPLVGFHFCLTEPEKVTNCVSQCLQAGEEETIK